MKNAKEKDSIKSITFDEHNNDDNDQSSEYIDNEIIDYLLFDEFF